MKKLFTLLFIIGFFSLSAQNNSKNVIISKATADWCPNCGTWGWSFMEALKEEFSDGSAILLGVHHSGGLENPVSNWFANNLGNTYQPQFFVNNARFSVNSGNWEQKVAEIKDEVALVSDEESGAIIEFGDTYVDADLTIHTSLTVTPDNLPTAEYYAGIYLFENNVIWFQSQQSSNAMHPFVLRDVMADEYYGDMFIPELNPSGSMTIDKTYNIESNTWVPENIGLLGILWKKDGEKYIMENSQVIYNVGLLSSNENVIEPALVDIQVLPGTMEVSIDNPGTYDLNIYDSTGRQIYNNTLEYTISIPTTNIVDGLYHVIIQSEKERFAKTIFIR